MSRYQPRRSRNPAGSAIAGARRGADYHRLGFEPRRIGRAELTIAPRRESSVTPGTVPSLRSIASAARLDERRDLLQQRTRLLEQRRRTADGVGGDLHERIVPRQAGLVSRRVVQPPRRQDLGLLQRPHVTARAGEFHRVEQSVHRAPRRLIGAFHGREVGMRAHIVRRQEQVRNGGGRLGTQSPRCRRD